MRLRSAFLQGKKSESTCEDGYVFCENYAAVVDGVTSKSEYLFFGKTPGRIGMEAICAEVPLLEPGLTAVQAIARLNEALMRARVQMAQEHEVTILDFPRACAAVYSKARREIWLAGDCQCCVNGKVYTNPKKIDDVLVHLRSFVLQAEMLEGKTEDELLKDDYGRQAILPFLHKQLLFENAEGIFGYLVLNGEKFIEEQLMIIPVPEGSLVTLATDGYPVLRESFDESEAALSDMLERDVHCYKQNLQTKGIRSGNVSYDDRCFLQFTT